MNNEISELYECIRKIKLLNKDQQLDLLKILSNKERIEILNEFEKKGEYKNE